MRDKSGGEGKWAVSVLPHHTHTPRSVNPTPIPHFHSLTLISTNSHPRYITPTHPLIYPKTTLISPQPYPFPLTSPHCFCPSICHHHWEASPPSVPIITTNRTKHPLHIPSPSREWIPRKQFHSSSIAWFSKQFLSTNLHMQWKYTHGWPSVGCLWLAGVRCKSPTPDRQWPGSGPPPQAAHLWNNTDKNALGHIVEEKGGWKG